MTKAARKHQTRSKLHSHGMLLVTGLGLLVAGAGFYSLGCLYLDGTCTMTDDGFYCVPDCESDDVMCLEEQFAGRKVVDNWLAEPGDVTICPYTGLKFEVERESSRLPYEGYLFVFSCDYECIEEVARKPGRFLDDLVEEAGGPASDPDPNLGGAIEEDD